MLHEVTARPSARALAGATAMLAAAADRDGRCANSLGKLARAHPFKATLAKRRVDVDLNTFTRYPVPWGEGGASREDLGGVRVTSDAAAADAVAALGQWARTCAEYLHERAQVPWHLGCALLRSAVAAVQIGAHYKPKARRAAPGVSDADVPLQWLLAALQAGRWTAFTGNADNALDLVLRDAGEWKARAVPCDVAWSTLALCATHDGVMHCLAHPARCAEALCGGGSDDDIVDLISRGTDVLMQHMRKKRPGDSRYLTQASGEGEVA